MGKEPAGEISPGGPPLPDTKSPQDPPSPSCTSWHETRSAKISVPFRSLRWRIPILALRVILGVVFLYAGISKAINPATFKTDLAAFRLLPEFALAPMAFYLPYLELLVGASLVIGILYSGGLLLTGGLLAGFFAFLISAWYRGLDISCGCFGRDGDGSSVEAALLRNLVLAAIWAVLVWRFLRKNVPQVSVLPPLEDHKQDACATPGA
jgi:putative oxidoreductase